MKGRRLRVLLAVAVVLGLVAAAAAAVSVAESLIELWERLREGPVAIYYGLIVFLALLSLLAGWLVWSLLAPRRRSRPRRRAAPVTEEALRGRVEAQRAAGLDVGDAERELRELARRREEGCLYVCLFGEISTGKSSLISTLVPDRDIAVDVRGGTTVGTEHHRWHTPAGDEIVLADVPGTGAGLDEAAMAEAVRAQLVVYVVDGDLTRSQYHDLQALLAIGKPVILALNKSDRYSEAELGAIESRLRERLAALEGGADVEVVTVSAAAASTGGTAALRSALQRELDRDPATFELLRDTAVFERVAGRLDAADADHRRARADEIVGAYTRKAVVGALAAISPGADVLIQGYLGTGLVRALCDLYGVAARDIDLDRVLALAGGSVGRSLPILLAVAGNALKAFPGVGTIAGGLTHAVAYGLIFDALGSGLSASLDEGGELRPAVAVRRFQENLGENLGARAVRIARLAMEESEKPGD